MRVLKKNVVSPPKVVLAALFVCVARQLSNIYLQQSTSWVVLQFGKHGPDDLRPREVEGKNTTRE